VLERVRLLQLRPGHAANLLRNSGRQDGLWVISKKKSVHGKLKHNFYEKYYLRCRSHVKMMLDIFISKFQKILEKFILFIFKCKTKKCYQLMQKHRLRIE